MTILLTQIDEGDRARKSYGDLSGLKDSLTRLGSIHPLIVSKRVDGNYDLIAGGRRLRSAKELNVTELHHGSILEPGKIGFLFKDEVPADVLKEAELDENLYRLQPKWQEDCVLVADVHEIKKTKDIKWGQRQTAELLGKGYGTTNVNHALRLAKLIREGDEDILACETMSDAIATLIKRKEEAALAELSRRVMPAVSTASFLDSFSISFNKKKGGDAPLSSAPVAPETPASVQSTAVSDAEPTFEPGGSAEPVEIPLSKMFVCGDFREVVKGIPDESFDHVVTDIPYGQDPDNMDTIKNIADVEKEHQVDYCVSLFEPFLKESYRLVKSGGFCAFFYDPDHHNLLQDLAKQVGWRVQRWPLIAHKTSACQNNAAQYNFTKNYETIMVLRRDEKTVLRSQQPSSVWSGDFAAERRLYNNPFAKPFELWKWLYSAIAFPGQTTLDLFCGEMSSCRAAVNCGLVPFGIELKENHFNRGLEHMKAVYALLHKGNVQFT